MPPLSSIKEKMIKANYISNDEFIERNPGVDVSQFSTATLSGMITTASDKVDNFLEYTLPIETIANEKVEGYVDSDTNLVVFPRKQPIQAVRGIDVVKGSDRITLSLTNGAGNDRFDLPEPRNYVLYPDAELSVTSVSIIGSFRDLMFINFYTELDYDCGYETVPEWGKESTELYLLDTLARRQNTAGAKKIKQGGIAIEYSERSGKSDFVMDAESILASFKKTTGW